METQTGFQRRRQEQQIDQSELRISLVGVHETRKYDQMKLTESHLDIWLDEGEASLWTHAVERTDDWIFCGPDKASLRFGCQLGHRARLVSMERLLKDVGARSQQTLKENYTQSWHERFLTTVVLRG